MFALPYEAVADASATAGDVAAEVLAQWISAGLGLGVIVTVATLLFTGRLVPKTTVDALVGGISTAQEERNAAAKETIEFLHGQVDALTEANKNLTNQNEMLVTQVSAGMTNWYDATQALLESGKEGSANVPTSES